MRILHKEAVVADRLGWSQAYLRNLRCRGEGPPWVILGARSIRYDEEELEQWLAENLVPCGVGR